MDQANQGSGFYLDVEFFDEDGVAAVPQSGMYDVFCITTQTVIRPPENITPLSTKVRVTFDASDTAIVNEQNYYEHRRVTVKIMDAAGQPLNQEYDYQVKNLLAV